MLYCTQRKKHRKEGTAMPSRVVDWKTITDFVTEAFVKYDVP